MRAFLDVSEDSLPTVQVERITYGKPFLTIGELAGIVLSEEQLDQLVACLVRAVSEAQRKAA